MTKTARATSTTQLFRRSLAESGASTATGRIPGVEVTELVQRHDHRGWLVEVLRTGNGEAVPSGQIYVTAAHPGVTKGGHYHTRKVEWFCVVRGQGRLALEDVHSQQRQHVMMSQEKMVTVRIPPGVAHAITNTGSDLLLLLVYSNEVFNPDDPDTLPQTVS